MSNVRDYLRKRAERKENKQTAKNLGNLIMKHRMAIITRTILVILLCAGLGATIYVQLKNQVFTSYVTLSSVDKQQYDNAVCLNYEKGFLTYSKDGISYTDTKGSAIWNQTFEMQDPMVRIAGTRVAVADYNGHIIHNIALSGDAVEIDTNLPIRQYALAENGMVAAILEDTNITWIYLYNSTGEKVAYIKTTMQKSGYPAAVALSPDGKLLAVSYITVESGAAKSSVAFYNFSSVGQNFVDNFASGADYVDAVIPYLTFISGDTAFAVADNRLVIYSGDQRPKSAADVMLDEEIQSIFYNENYIGLVFLDTTGAGKYRLDIYNTSGAVVTSLYFDMDYKDIILYKDIVIIYNETQCAIFNMKGLERFRGEFEKPVLLFSPLSVKKYLAVSKDSIDIIEMK